jgi:hypothetical protein
MKATRDTHRNYWHSGAQTVDPLSVQKTLGTGRGAQPAQGGAPSSTLITVKIVVSSVGSTLNMEVRSPDNSARQHLLAAFGLKLHVLNFSHSEHTGNYTYH